MRNLYNQATRSGSEGGGGGTYSLRHMKLQQGMSVDFSLLGFCELFVKMGIDFKHFELLKGMV